MAKHNEIGKVGEDLAMHWLIKGGFTIIERNYSRKWGEIDIVARGTSDRLHFVEVKSVSYGTEYDLKYAVTHETYRPEDNVHKNKQDRLKRAIQTWMLEHKYEGEFQIDIVTVRIVLDDKFAQINLIENVVFE